MILDPLKRFFRYVKDNYTAARDDANLRYASIKGAVSNIVENLNETAGYADRTIDKIYSKSKGLKGIFDDIETGAGNIYSRARKMGRDVRTIEDILKRKTASENDTINDEDFRKKTYVPKKVPKRPSRTKSVVMAAAAGLGTAKGVYDSLRNHGSLKNDDAPRNDERQERQDITHPYTSIDDHVARRKVLEDMIAVKNKYFWKSPEQLQDIIGKEYESYGYNCNVRSLLSDAMRLKSTDEKYSGLPRLNYDSRIAPKGMYEEMIDLYSSSDQTLKQIASNLEKKYGMGVSVSTISRNARKYLKDKGHGCRNRKEARKISGYNSKSH